MPLTGWRRLPRLPRTAWLLLVALCSSGCPSVASSTSSEAVQVRPARSHSSARPHPRLQGLPDNTALDLGRYTCNAPADDPSECETITDYSRLVYDAGNHQFLMFGGGHAATHRTDVDVFSYETLEWSSAYPSTPCAQMRLANLGRENGEWLSTGHPIARHTYDMLVMADSIQRLVMLGQVTGGGSCVERSPATGKDPYFFQGKIALYDPVARTWSYSSATTRGWEDYGTAEYDPVSGLVIIVDRSSVWTYDPRTEAKSERARHSIDGLGYGKNLVYFPPTRTMYYIADGHLIVEVRLGAGPTPRLSLSRLSGITGAVPRLRETGFAYDAVNRVIGGGITDGVFYAFDPLTKTWSSRVMRAEPAGLGIGTVAYHALDYDPVNNVFLFVTRKTSGKRTWVYRLAGGSRSSRRGPSGAMRPGAGHEILAHPDRPGYFFPLTVARPVHRAPGSAPPPLQPATNHPGHGRGLP